jgi:hypothetical protein
MKNAVPPRSSRFGHTMLRSAPMRYLIAELITFGCLFAGMILAREWRPVGVPVGTLIAFLGGTLITIYYLYKVLGSSAGWVLPLTLLMLGNAVLGNMVIGNGTVYDAAHPRGTHLVITGTYWTAWGSLLGAIAITVALAAASGERWARRHPPRDRFEALARPRGRLAGLWLPAYSRESGSRISS